MWSGQTEDALRRRPLSLSLLIRTPAVLVQRRERAKMYLVSRVFPPGTPWVHLRAGGRVPSGICVDQTQIPSGLLSGGWGGGGITLPRSKRG